MATDSTSQASEKAVHVVLIGDSVFDNAVYIPASDSDVCKQIQEVLTKAAWDGVNSRKVTSLAADGSGVSGAMEQLKRIPADATHIVLSAGGNDALHARGTVLSQSVSTVSEAVMRLHAVHKSFETAYNQLLSELKALGKPLLLLVPYHPRFDSSEEMAVAYTGFTMYSDVMYRAAARGDASIVDLRLVFDEEADWANAIEPSAHGGMKIARKVGEFVAKNL